LKGGKCMEQLTVKQPLQFVGSRLVRAPDKERPIIHTPTDAACFLHERIATGLDREVFGVICLSPAGHVNHCEIISVGTIENTLADPRAVYKAAILSAASAVILFHTHPTTELTAPSLDDLRVTARMYEAGELMHVLMLDHLILTDKKWLAISDLASANDERVYEYCIRKLKEAENEHGDVDQGTDGSGEGRDEEGGDRGRHDDTDGEEVQ
jgi:DNA repair protein RadC